MNARTRQRCALLAFCACTLVLYVYGVLTASLIPAHIEEIILPLDFAVGVPLGFYFLVVKPRNLSLLTVLPVIWVGYALSSFALGSLDAGALPYLASALIPVEIGIAAKECWRLACIYKDARTRSEDPMVWFKELMLYLVRKDMPASMAATELGVWRYALFSWREKPLLLPGEKAFSYHNAGGYMNMMLGLALALPVEIVGVHLLVSQWSVPAAVVITALSIYMTIWLAGDARARMLRPVTVGDAVMRLECGVQMRAEIPISEIAQITFAEAGVHGLAKEKQLNYGTFYQANVWVITKHPVVVDTVFGKKKARAIGLSLDDPIAFKSESDGKSKHAL